MTNFLRFLAAALACAATIAGAQNFGPEKRISPTATPQLTPNIAAVGSNVYIVWNDNLNTGGTCTDGQAGGYCGKIYFSRSTDGGANFSAPVNLSSAAPAARNDRVPIIAASGAQVHVFWSDDQLHGDVFYRRSTDSGATFAPEVKLTTTDGFYSRATGALVDSAGNVHFAYYDAAFAGGAAGQVMYQCSSNQGANWSAPVQVSRFDGATDFETPRLAQGTDGTLYMMVRASRNGLPQSGWPPFRHFLYRSQSPSNAVGCSVNWLHPVQEVNPGVAYEFANTFGGLVASGASNVLHAAYWSDKAGTNLVYRRGFPNGKGWEAPIDVSGFGLNHLEFDGTAAEHASFGIAEDNAGKVHLVFGQNAGLRDGTPAGPLYYRCSNDGGATFLSRTLASAQPETAQPRAAQANNVFHMVWIDWRDNQFGAKIYYRNLPVGSCTAALANISVSSPSLAFGGQSMGTTSPPQTVTFTNTGGATATGFNVTVGAQFAINNNCPTSLGAGSQCTVDVFFTPSPAPGAINSTTNVTATLNVTSSQGNPQVNLSGTGEKSLVTHYYRSILRRAPDGGGKAYWEGEAIRMQNLGANVNEVWYAMAQYFYFSPEYVAFNRDPSGFVTDLYNTFFNRAPDGAGLGYWVGQINSGLPREVVLAGFMFSTEFTTFAQGVFGNTAARAEVDMVGDFFRGLLARLPDDGGFNAWVGNFRSAQCQGANTGNAIYAQVESISNAFVSGGEYTARNRTNAQYVGDLYNAFLRRGGDLNGVNYWVNQLNTSAQNRSQVRQAFIGTPEFSQRVNAVGGQGCLP